MSHFYAIASVTFNHIINITNSLYSKTNIFTKYALIVNIQNIVKN